MVTIVIVIFLLSSAVLSVATSSTVPPPSSPERPGCSDDLVHFFPCLPYVSQPPNDLMPMINHHCCEAFHSILESGAGNCLCYLIRQPMFLGFPLNVTKVRRLSSACEERRGRSETRDKVTLASLCSSDSSKLPPLQRPTDSETSKPSDYGPKDSTPNSISLPPESYREMPFPFSFAPISDPKSPPQPSSSTQATTRCISTQISTKLLLLFAMPIGLI